jgi:predicted transcriptional regulator
MLQYGMARPGPAQKCMTILTASLAPEVYQRLRRIAVDENTNMRVLIRRAVDEYLERYEKERRKSK